LINNNIITPTDPFIIGVNNALFIDIQWPDDIPLIVRILFGVGDHTFIYDFDTNQAEDQGFNERHAVYKKSGERVSTNVFLDMDYVGISALLFSNATISKSRDQIAHDLLLIHNPNARNPISRGWLKVGKEYWYENDALHRCIWS